MFSNYVLILDKSKMVRSVMKGLLQADGYEVMETGSVEKARRIMDRFPIDVLIIDGALPGMGSIALLAYVQANKPEVARIMMIDDSHSATAVSAMGLGRAQATLLKPITEEELRFCLSQARTKARIQRMAADDIHEPTDPVGFFGLAPFSAGQA